MSNNKYTRLDFTKRLMIQSNLNEGASLSSIARLIGVSASTVSREIKTHRIKDNHVTRFHHNSCVHVRFGADTFAGFFIAQRKPAGKRTVSVIAVL